MDEQRDVTADLAHAVAALASGFEKWLQGMRPVFDYITKLADDPAVQAYIAVRQQGGHEPERACHCLCGKSHPDARGVCDGEAVTTRHFDSPTVGPVDVPICWPCAAAQGVALP